MSQEAIVYIENLRIQSEKQTLLFLPHFECNASEIHALIGESGSGKSLTLLTIIGLLPKNLKATGTVILKTPTQNLDLLSLKNDDFRKLRGKYIGT